MSPFDICQQHPILWKYIKLIFIICYLISNFILSNFIYNRFLIKFNYFNIPHKKIKINNLKNKYNSNKLNLLIGENKNKEKIYIPESGLFQNFLITRNNWFWKNKFGYVSLYKTNYGI